MAATDITGADQARQQVELSVGGMTCASCAMRIEKKLNRLDGVTATVNYATEKAKVDFPSDVDPAELVSAVESAGYTAALPATRAEGAGEPAERRARRLATRYIRRPGPETIPRTRLRPKAGSAPCGCWQCSAGSRSCRP